MSRSGFMMIFIPFLNGESRKDRPSNTAMIMDFIGGLYEYSDRLSCWLCPLQSIASLKSLYIHHRELWEKLKKMDDQVIANGHKWRYRQFHEGDLTLTQWEERFKREIEYEKREMSLF